MSAIAYQWMYWVMGGLGLSGAVALAIFAPVVALALWKIVYSFIRLLLGTRIGCALLVGCFAWVASDLNRHKIDDAAFAEKTAQTIAAQKARDATIAASTRTLVLKETADVRAFEQAGKTAVDAFTRGLSAGACPVGADADRLRAIAGSGSVKRQHHRRVWKPAGKGDASGHQRKDRLSSPVGRSPGGSESGK